MRRGFARRNAKRFAEIARSLPPGGLGVLILVAVGTLHLLAIGMVSGPARAYLSPRYSLVISAAFLAVVAIATVSTSLLAISVATVPFLQLGWLSAAGIAFQPTLVLGGILSLGLILRLLSERQGYRRLEWTITGKLSLWSVVAALVAVALSLIANGQNLSYSVPWLVSFSVGSAIILSARHGYLKASAIPTALLIGFAISAASDLRDFSRGASTVKTGPHAGRFVGGVGDYELLAEYYSVGIIVALGSFVYIRRVSVAILASYVTGAGLFLIFATQSRGPVILLAVACPSFLIIAFMGRRTSRSRLVFAVGATASLGVALAPLIATSNTFARIASIVDRGDLIQTINRSSVWPLIVSDPKFLSAGLFGNGPAGVYEWFGTWPHSMALWAIWSLGLMGAVVLASLTATGVAGIAQWRRHGWVSVTLGFSLCLLLLDQVKVEFAREGSMVLFVLALCALVGAASIAEGNDGDRGRFAE